MTALNTLKSIGASGRKITPNTGFMSAPFVGLVACTSIVQRQRVGTHSF